jgi:transcriptional regulator with XRE-family HTH domain
MDLNVFALRLKSERIHSGYTQVDVATKVGIQQAAVSSWERGVCFPSHERTLKLARIFDVSVDWLLGRQGSSRSSHDARKVLAEVVEALPEVLAAEKPEVVSAIRKEPEIPFVNLAAQTATRHNRSPEDHVAWLLKLIDNRTADPESKESVSKSINVVAAPFCDWRDSMANPTANMVSRIMRQYGYEVTIDELILGHPVYTWRFSWS